MINLSASILAKLKNKSKELNINYQQCLRLFFQEEFLRRLSKSAYAENLILKGGMFIYILTGSKSRTTVDIDFMAKQFDNTLDYFDKIINEIIDINTGINEVVILKASRCVPIAVHREYHGVRSQIIGKINKVTVSFDVDIGVGDVIYPAPEKRTIQTQLDGFDIPKIMTYSIESTIAEKLDAILQRLELTGRMKDFYDIFFLAGIFNFDGSKLCKAIKLTFMNRKTEITHDSLNNIILLESNNDMKVRWRYFLKTINEKELEFSDVIKIINKFLKPVLDSIVLNETIHCMWYAEKLEWE